MKPCLDAARAASLYLQGESTPTIARALGSSPAAVRKVILRAGVPMRSISDAVSLASRGDRHVSNGYVTLTVGKHTRRNEHVVIAERALGRPLKRNECVHHINCDKTDNRPENLLICTRAYHTALHHRMAKQEEQQ